MKEIYKLFCSCPLNAEDLLENEIKLLGGEETKISPSGVGFKGSLEVIYKVSLCSRIGGKLFLELLEFDLNDQHEIYTNAKSIEWDQHFNLDDTFATSAVSVKSRIKNSKYASLLLKDGIADYFMEKYKQRPNVQRDKPSVKIHLHVNKNIAQISLDLSGDSLHKRGYRGGNASAAIKENVASAMLYRANWPEMAKEGLNFLDPMCGSGTFLLEAAYMATNTPSGYYRHYYSFLGWKKHDVDLWDEVFDEEESKIIEFKGIIRGFDMDKTAIAHSIENIKSANFDKIIHVEKNEVDNFEPTANILSHSGLICINPPYGIRLGNTQELKKLYEGFTEIFLEKLPGWKLSIITGDEELSRAIPLKIDKKHVLYNGAIKCSVSHFTLEGDKIKVESPVSEEAMAFKNRLVKKYKHLKKWARRNDISCYRLYDADLPNYNFAVDFYENKWVSVSEYQAPKDVEVSTSRKRLDDGIKVIHQVLEIPKDDIFLKVRQIQKGSKQYTKNESSQEFQVIRESGAKFYANFKDYLDTGIFLDHRPIRKKVKNESKGKKVLNLFSYTGTVTSLAALGGASKTITVDASKTYLDWAKRNLQLNGLANRDHLFFRSDVREWLKKDGNSYDIIFLDPPTFSNSKSGRDVFDIQTDYIELINLCAKILNKNGVLYFSNNYRKFKFDYTLFPNLEVKDISSDTIDEDFKNNQKIHKCWEIRWQMKN